LQGKCTNGNHLQVDQWEGPSLEGRPCKKCLENDETYKTVRSIPKLPEVKRRF
jgi:hypothetical protein